MFELSPVSGQKIGDLEFQAGEASLRFTTKGILENASPHTDKEVHGYRFAKNMTIEFHHNGKLSRGTLAEEQVKNGLKLKTKSEIRFFPTAQIQAAKLSDESTVGTYKIKELTLGEDRVIKLHPYIDQSAVEKSARAGDRINLSEDGRVMGWSSSH